MYGCESWTIKRAEHQRIDAFKLWCWRRLLRVPWTARRSNQNPKGNQSWIFIGRTDAEAETAIHWPPDAKNCLIGKDPDAGKDWRQENKGMTEDEMVGWHHWLNGHEYEQALGDGEGQGSLASCSPWGRKGSDTTECLNNKMQVAFIPSTTWGSQIAENKQVPSKLSRGGLWLRARVEAALISGSHFCILGNRGSEKRNDCCFNW